MSLVLRFFVVILGLTIASLGCRPSGPMAWGINRGTDSTGSYPVRELRAQTRTQLGKPTGVVRRIAAPEPPPGLFERVMYAAPLGQNVAYVSPVHPGSKRPAIIWIAGGFDWGIDADAWKDTPRQNDQTARAFRDAGIVLMRPSLRGTNLNPGQAEYFLGEVDDVIAAADFLAQRPDVDPDRIYLGGHSTGGTVVLLVAESTSKFRCVFSFGPVPDVRSYGDGWAPFDQTKESEIFPRSPGYHLATIRTPTFVIEGSGGNIAPFHYMRKMKQRAPVTFIPLFGADHFNILAPMTERLAQKILADHGPQCSIKLSESEIDDLVLEKLVG